MFYLGIDIAKNNHVASLLDSEGNILFKGFSFTNTKNGYNSLIAKVNKITSEPDEVLVGMEATGHYWLSTYTALIEDGYQVSVINPFLIKSYRSSMSVRNQKNDKIDSYIIAEFMKERTPDKTIIPDSDYINLKQLTRFRSKLVNQIASIKNQVISVLDKVFPEYTTIFSDTFGMTSKQLLLKYPTPEEMLKVNTRTLANLLNKSSKGRFSSDKAKELKSIAKESFGTKLTVSTAAFEIKQLVNHIIFIESQISEIDDEIKIIYDSLNTYLTTIPGIGLALAPIILGEIGDINNFAKKSQLIAFAGIEPTIAESGNKFSTNEKTSKRGSPYLRHAVHTAALVAMSTVPEYREYYDKKRKEGKHHNVALAGISRKLLNVIYSVLKDQRPYEPRK